jgi:meso-butanediol dehydrogenase/(S,S)-butanediol dehydrogenase/diacetyl reductase
MAGTGGFDRGPVGSDRPVRPGPGIYCTTRRTAARPEDKKIEQKTAIVTGAARGIGLATTRLFLKEGRKVAMIDRDAEPLQDAARDLDGVLPVLCDVSIPEQVDAMLEQVASGFGRIDALVNNAGIADFGPIGTTDFQTWRTVMETNLDGVFLTSQRVVPELIKTCGAIVNIASISGLRASTLRVAYGTSKAAVIQLTRQQAIELGEHGVRANCVAPGPVNTKLALAVHSPEIRAAYHDAIPLNRYGTEMEIAEVIIFLCSPKASYLTGQIIAVDGGFEAAGVGLPALRD